MGSLMVVEVVPWLEVLVSFCGVCPVFGVGPLSEGSLDEAFRLAVGSWGVGPGATVLKLHLLAGLFEVVRAVA